MAKFPWMTLGDGTDVDQTSVSRQETTDIADGDQTTISRQETSNIEKAYARFTVQHKVAIVTGGAGGLGFEASKALLEHGLECLAIFDITKDQGNQAALELRRLFSTKIIIFHQVNISNDEEIRTAVAEVVTRFKQIDILLSFAGIVHCEHALNAPIEEWRKVQDVNVNGQFTVAQTVAKAMVSIKHKDLSMVFVASVSGHTVNFPQPQAAYNTSKAAVIHMMHSLAAEWARYGIRVNSISPGYMDTRLNEGEELEEARQVWRSRTPMGRMGRRDELNGAVLLLCSAAGAYITGTDIKVDGGITLF